MAVCEVCGNDYDKAFRITRQNETFTFDSFECAVERLAPRCEHCNCRILGHGVEVDDSVYCCAHCAREDGKKGIEDRAEEKVRKMA